MLKWFLRRQFAGFERTWNYDASYIREIIDVDPQAMLAFGKVQGLSRYRKDVPPAAYCAAGLIAVMAEDCGPCTQLSIEMAQREEVDPATLRAIVTRDYAAMPDDVVLAVRYTEATLRHAPDADELRDGFADRCFDLLDEYAPNFKRSVTARQVLTRFMETHEGTAFIIESDARNVKIDKGEIDPNRMFSRAGAEASLKALNAEWTPQQMQSALAILDKGRDRLVRALLPPPKRLLVALHNNSEEYSVKEEVPISDSVSLREPANPHAFFLCTDPADFAALAKSPYNAVLQQKKPENDDGSLSRLAARQGVRYVNLEVRHGNKDRQLEMLRWLDWNLA